jgi:endonuclease/exonuclease/phosphatase family metal-dependent hydrolase
MGRALLGIDATLDGRPVRVCTGHLESLREGRRLRRAQVRVVADALAEAEGEALFAGDTNLRGEVDDELRAAGLVDAWQAVGAPADGRSTWWPWRGPRRATGPRFDRLWCTSGLAVREVSLTDPRLEGGERVSDHACLRVRLGVG